MGMGIEVGTSVGVLDAGVSVGGGVNVEAKDGLGVKVSVSGILVDVFSAPLEGETVGNSLLRLHAQVVAIKRRSKYRFFIFMASLY